MENEIDLSKFSQIDGAWHVLTAEGVANLEDLLQHELQRLQRLQERRSTEISEILASSEIIRNLTEALRNLKN